MAQRSFSVVVLPDDWAGSLDELAQKMMPVTRRGSNQVLPLLARGAMTLEADLSVEEAGLLQARLNKLGVPAQVVNDAGEVVSESTHRGPSAAARNEGRESTFVGRPNAAETKRSGREGTFMGRPGRDRDPEQPSAQESQDDSAWMSVFPNLEDESPNADEARPADRTDEWRRESSKNVDGSGSAPSLDELAGDASGSFGAEPAPPSNSAKPPAVPSESKISKSHLPSRETARRKPPGAPPTQSPPARPRDSKSKSALEPRPQNRGFDAGKMSDALRRAAGDKPPYAPEGFDDSMTHIPLIAALLSLIAPGAGQVYNGQSEEAREFGVRFALLTPWYESVRQAHEYAEKIRTYWAPRPEPGALMAAFKYLAVWWLVAGAAFAALGWTGLKLYDVAKTPEAPKITRAEVASAIDEAREEFQIARISALDGVAAYLDKRDRNHERFTMSKAERAERLFRRGLVYCKNENYATCASAMKRVSSLSPRLRRDAYRLQAWASVQQSADRNKEPMPEVSIVESLEAFEQREHKIREKVDAELGDAKTIDAEKMDVEKMDVEKMDAETRDATGAPEASDDQKDASETPP